MTDYNTMTRLRKKSDCLPELDGSIRQSVLNPKYIGKKEFPQWKKTKDFIVITEDGEYGGDFHNIMALFNLKKEDLPLIEKQYYKKEFINDNWDLIFHNLSLFYTENTEDELEYLMELESYIAEEDWQLEELENFSCFKSFSVGGNFISLTDVSQFKGYSNGIVKKSVPALVFEVLFHGDTPAYFFSNFKKKVDHETTYMSRIFNVNDIDKHFDTKLQYSYVHEDEILEYKNKYYNSEDELEPHFVFAFG